jgi:hypothetical protein
MSLLITIPVAALLEVVWRGNPSLRDYRWHFRAQLALFWAAVLVIYFVSVSGLIPERVHYGRGVLRFASDAVTYQQQAEGIAAGLAGGSMTELLDWQVSTYSRVLGVAYVVFGSQPVVGMLLNAIFYMTVLACVALLGRQFFDRPVTLLAIWIVALWPGFFLHATQTLRWCATSAALLVVLTAVMALLDGAWPPAALAAAAGFGVILLDAPHLARLVALSLLVFSVLLLLVRRKVQVRLAPVLGLGILFLAAYHTVWGAPVRTLSSEVTGIPRWSCEG